MSMMLSFCAALFSSRDVSDEIFDLTESVSGVFPKITNGKHNMAVKHNVEQRS